MIDIKHKYIPSCCDKRAYGVNSAAQQPRGVDRLDRGDFGEQDAVEGSSF